MSPFTIKQDHFEGPLEVLLRLIEERKLHISDIALARVADDFLRYARERPQFPIAESAQFVLIAATLLLIKSKSLLPELALTEEEKGDIRDLEERLALYRRIRELSAHVRENFGAARLFEREERAIEPAFSPPRGLCARQLHESILRVLAEIPPAERVGKAVVEKVVRLEEVIEDLSARVKSALRVSFRELTASSADRAQQKRSIIVSFLALLELVKQGMVDATQERGFADIIMEAREVDTPRY